MPHGCDIDGIYKIRVHCGNNLDFSVKTYYSNFKMEI